MVKGYYHDAEDKVIGQIKFMADADDNSIDEKEIHDNAPEGWKCCCWNNETILAKTKKSKTKEKEVVEEIDESVDFDDE